MINEKCIVCGEHASCSSKFLSKPDEYRCEKHYEEYMKGYGVKIR